MYGHDSDMLLHAEYCSMNDAMIEFSNTQSARKFLCHLWKATCGTFQKAISGPGPKIPWIPER